MADETPKYSINDQLRGLVEQLSAYIETYHGGEVDFVDFDGKVVKVKLGGACLGCPLSPVTVKGWVEGTVKQFFPEVEGVQTVE
ncbi:MAG: NifU family protein [Bellilinea sp.]